MIKLNSITPPLNLPKSIALVGNSDILLAKKWGKEINGYDAVIRFNLATIKIPYTGRKTTVRVFGGPIGNGQCEEANIPIKDRKKILTEMTTGVNILVTSKNLENELIKINPKAKIHYMNGVQLYPWINRTLNELGITQKFTNVEGCGRTGFTVVLCCVKSGIVPHLYGFDWEKRVGYKHYYGNQVKNTTNNVRHEEITELEILGEMEKRGLIVVHR